MTTDIHRALMLLLAKRPLAVLRFEDGFGEALLHSRHGVNRFTIVRPHEELDDLKLPTLCLVEMPYGKDRECHVGVITTKAAIATFESRLAIIRLQPLHLASIQSIVARLGTQQFRTSLTAKLDKSPVVACLSSKLSLEIIQVLSKDAEDKKAIEKAAFYLPGLRNVTSMEWAQTDAIKMAMQAFGLNASDIPRELDLSNDTDSALEYLDASVLEDNVIARDANIIPGYRCRCRSASPSFPM